MLNLTPAVRTALTIAAAVIAALAAVQDQLPHSVQLVIVVLSTTLAGIGIIPPQVKTETVIRKDPS